MSDYSSEKKIDQPETQQSLQIEPQFAESTGKCYVVFTSKTKANGNLLMEAQWENGWTPSMTQKETKGETQVKSQ